MLKINNGSYKQNYELYTLCNLKQSWINPSMCHCLHCIWLYRYKSVVSIFGVQRYQVQQKGQFTVTHDEIWCDIFDNFYWVNTRWQ